MTETEPRKSWRQLDFGEQSKEALRTLAYNERRSGGDLLRMMIEDVIISSDAELQQLADADPGLFDGEERKRAKVFIADEDWRAGKAAARKIGSNLSALIRGALTKL